MKENNMNYYFYAGSVGVSKKFSEPVVFKAAKDSGSGEGVYSFEYNDEKNIIRPISLAYSPNCGIVCSSSDGRYVYGANETRDFDNGNPGSGGGISSFRIDEKSKALIPLNKSLSYGSRPAYVALSHDNHYIAVANHGSHTNVTCEYYQNENGEYVLRKGFDDANVALFTIGDNGEIKKVTDIKHFKNHGYWVDGKGQTTSHIHCVKINKNDIVAACNRGSDYVELFKIDRETDRLINFQHLFVGHGYAPRHVDFHPDLNAFYVCCENYPCLFVIKFDEKRNEYFIAQRLPTMDQQFSEKHPLPDFNNDLYNGCETDYPSFMDRSLPSPSDIHVADNGKFVCVSNRRAGNITTYRIDDNGLCEYLETFRLKGNNPRGFNISTDCTKLFVGLNDLNMVFIYRLDSDTHKIEEELCRVEVPSVASIAFLQGENNHE